MTLLRFYNVHGGTIDNSTAVERQRYAVYLSPWNTLRRSLSYYSGVDTVSSHSAPTKNEKHDLLHYCCYYSMIDYLSERCDSIRLAKQHYIYRAVQTSWSGAVTSASWFVHYHVTTQDTHITLDVADVHYACLPYCYHVASLGDTVDGGFPLLFRSFRGS